MIDFPSPLLAVAPDVLKEMDGEDALFGMWTGAFLARGDRCASHDETDSALVFTKCKSSLKDGRRLENLSWRLWHREMACLQLSDSSSSASSSPSLPDTRCATPITPISEVGPNNGDCHSTVRLCILLTVPDDYSVSSDNSSRDSLQPGAPGPLRHSWHGEDNVTSHASTRRLSTASMPVRPRTRSSSSQRVGTIILDILPGKVVVPERVHTYPTSDVAARRYAVPGSTSGTPRSVTAGTFSPTSGSRPPIAQPKPQLALPSVQLPSTPPAPGAPRVVVVNPTPHPTPPATPHPNQTATGAAPAPSPTHLTLPPVRPVLNVRQPARPVATASKANTPAAVGSSKPDAPGANPEKSAALPHVPTPSTAAKSAVPSRDDTLKPSDRRFFLQASGSPDQDSPERTAGPSTAANAPEASPTDSAASSNVRSDAPVPPRRNVSKPNLRGKGIRGFTTIRTAGRAQAQRQAAQRRATEPKKTTFNIGSASSNGTSREGRSQKASSPPQTQVVPKPRPPSPAKAPPAPGRKGLVMSTSSEYTTDSDDDSEWASEDNSAANSADERERERQREETRLLEAAEEAQRQRDMFAKVPKRSYSNLNRTRSGLLSQLMNPDPNIFPPNHPVRASMSTQDMTQLGRQGARLPQPSALTSRSSAAMPVMTQVTPTVAQAQVSPSSGTNESYRPRGRPQDAEMEDDSESEDPNNGIQLSQSVAHQRLAAIAGASRRRASDQSPQTRPPPATTSATALPSREAPREPPQGQRSALTSVATAPIPLGFPYNLPAPAPPMTPRTTRRQMLSTELSESLRRNLLWERQVSKVSMLGGARRGGLNSRLQPMTALNAQQQQPAGGDERERQRRAALSRNRSMDDDYHTAGW